MRQHEPLTKAQVCSSYWLENSVGQSKKTKLKMRNICQKVNERAGQLSLLDVTNNSIKRNKTKP